MSWVERLAAPGYLRLLLTLTWQALTFAEDLHSAAEHAKQAMLSKRYSEAAAIYRRMATQFPTEPGIRFNLALALHSLGRYGESTETLEGIRDAAKDNAKFWFLLGEGYLRLGQPKRAVEPLRKAEALEPSNLNTSLELGSAWLESGQFPQAASHFRLLADKHPDVPGIWAGLSVSQSSLGDTESAQECMIRLAALPPSVEQRQMLDRVQAALARAMVTKREFAQAAVILRALLAKDPENAAWQFDMGDSLLNTGQTGEAIEHLIKAVAISPRLLPAQAKLGEALLLTGSAAEAAAHLALASPIDTDGSINFQLATAYRRLGKNEQAAKAMARYSELEAKSRRGF